VEELLVQISNFGFPIVVSAYLLIRIEKKLSDLSFNINELARAIDVLSLKRDSLTKKLAVLSLRYAKFLLFAQDMPSLRSTNSHPEGTARRILF